MANLWTIYFKEFQMLRAMQAQSDSCLSWVPGDATRGPARQRHHVACVCLCLSGDAVRGPARQRHHVVCVCLCLSGDATRGPARQRHHVACVCLCLSGDGARFNHCLFASNPHQNIKKVIR